MWPLSDMSRASHMTFKFIYVSHNQYHYSSLSNRTINIWNSTRYCVYYLWVFTWMAYNCFIQHNPCSRSLLKHPLSHYSLSIASVLFNPIRSVSCCMCFLMYDKRNMIAKWFICTRVLILKKLKHDLYVWSKQMCICFVYPFLISSSGLSRIYCTEWLMLLWQRAQLIIYSRMAAPKIWNHSDDVLPHLFSFLVSVTTCGLARDALNLLREKKDGYDIVISDVNMPDMDGFKLLEHVGLEMDLPVISQLSLYKKICLTCQKNFYFLSSWLASLLLMSCILWIFTVMSVDGETSRVMKGVQHGACDYLLKPIRMKELRNIWQHVFRKKIHEIRDIESHDSFEGIQISRNLSDLSDDGHMFGREDLSSGKKRKDFENKHDDRDFGDNSSTKKHRVVWSVDLHQKFVKAVNQIGFDSKCSTNFQQLSLFCSMEIENLVRH